MQRYLGGNQSSAVASGKGEVLKYSLLTFTSKSSPRPTPSLTRVSHREALAFPQHGGGPGSPLPSARLKPLRISTWPH